jgi:pyridinium-3,5-biscarboxylic acid mononucleotide sulfurtransferase
MRTRPELDLMRLPRSVSLSSPNEDLSCLGSNERNSPEAKARGGPNERERVSHWAGVRSLIKYKKLPNEPILDSSVSLQSQLLTRKVSQIKRKNEPIFDLPSTDLSPPTASRRLAPPLSRATGSTENGALRQQCPAGGMWEVASTLDIGGGRWHFEGVSKLDQLRELLRSYGSCLVAYSGGVDSVFLARVARDVLGDKSLAVIADSASLPRRELEEALEIAERFQIPVRVVKTQEFQNPNYTANPTNRCYFCKHELFTELEPIAREEKFAVIAYGENASDVGDFRPGAQAAKEFQVRAPLKEVGMTKAEIREYSAQLGLPTADKPQMACLSSRIPHGEAVTPVKLRMIEAAEYVLRDLGFYDVRVRHHELGGERAEGEKSEGGGRKTEGGGEEGGGRRAEFAGLIPSLRSSAPGLRHLARIEVGAAELPKLLSNGLSQRVAEALKEIGYAHVTLDLQGYRRGGADLRRAEAAGVQG